MIQTHKRHPHIMKSKKDLHHPSNFFFFDTETKDKSKGKVKDIQTHQLWFGWCWAFRYEDGKITRAMKSSFETYDEFYDLMASRLDKSRPLYVVAHNLGFDLTIVDFWEQADNREMECLYAVLEDPPLFLSYRWQGCKLIFIDTFNFWKCSVADMGKALGIPKIEIDITKATRKEADPYCIRDVEILANQLIGLLDFLSEHDLGSFGISAPAIAMNTYKKRFMKHEIFIHDRTKVLALERQCYYGGLVNNFFVGSSKGQIIYHTDVNSLYPSVMIKDYPTKLIGSWDYPKPKDLDQMPASTMFVADVTLETKTDCYPKRMNGRLCEVKGRFRTQLAGEEFARAVLNKHIKIIHHLAAYETAPIFKSYVEYFWSMRQKYSYPKGNPKEQLIKLLMNSLYGKFGMKGFDWKDFTHTNLEAYYDLMQVPYPKDYRKGFDPPNVTDHIAMWKPIGLDHAIKLRYLNGKLQLQFPTGEHTESFCAIAAFVTSYARERLRELIRIAGQRNTLYCDTDSLFLTKQGYANLERAGELSQSELGKLKLEGIASDWSFYGPKDYTFAKKVVMKGIRKNAKHIKGTTYEQLQFEGLKSVLNRGAEGYILIKTIRKTNKRVYNKGTILSSGWTEPYHLSE